MFKWRLVLLLGIVLLGGCSAFPVTLRENRFVGRDPAPGTVIFSVSVDEKELREMDHLWLTFQRKDRSQMRDMVFDLKDHRFANAFSVAEHPSSTAVRVVVLQFPAGQYRLLGWKGYAAGQRRHRWLLRSPEPDAERGDSSGFPYQFAVGSGEKCYLGRIEISTQKGEYRGVRILDQMQADLEAVTGRLAQGAAAVSKVLLTPENH